MEPSWHNFLTQYPYFVGDFIGLAGFTIMVLLFPSQRRFILLSSFFALPQAFLGLILIPEYWNPKRIIDIGIGPEDLLFMFLVGGMAWAEAVWIVRRRIVLSFKLALALRRFFVSWAFFGAGYGSVAILGIKKMNMVLIIALLWSMVLLGWRKELWPLALWGAILSTLLYSLSFKMMMLLWPEFTSLWVWKNLWGLSFWNIPLEEIVWALLYCPVSALTMAYLFDAQVKKI